MEVEVQLMNKCRKEETIATEWEERRCGEGEGGRGLF